MTDASLPQVEELKAGDVIDGKYQVERDLGIGGMGRVVLALHLGLEERVALKMLLPEATRDPEAVARFAREAKAAARIKSEHVARVLDISALGGKNPYIVMEYLEGSDLEQIVEAGGPLMPTQSCSNSKCCTNDNLTCTVHDDCCSGKCNGHNCGH